MIGNPVQGIAPSSSNVKTYYGGDNVKRPLVKLEAKSFTELYDRYIANLIRRDISAKEYADLTPQEKKVIKSCPYLTAGTFEGPGQRLKERLTGIGLISIDIDDSSVAKLFVDGGGPIPTLLTCNYALYHTISSTDDDPRIRLLVDVMNMTPDSYKLCVRALCSTLGLGEPNPESLDPTRPMYLPGVFLDAETSPIISHRVGAKPMHINDFAGVTLPEETEDDTNFLEFVRSTSSVAPIEGVTIDVAKDLLTHLDPDESYDRWTSALCGMKHQFSQTTQEDDENAFQVFNEWSLKGHKYTNEDDTRRKWRSFSPSRRIGQPITIKTLIQRAKKAGWKLSVSRATLEDTMRSEIELCEDIDTLRDVTLRKILENPVFDSYIKSELTNRVHKRLVYLGSLAGKTWMNKHIHSIKRDLAREAEQDGASPLPQWAQNWAHVASLGVFVNTINGLKIKPDSFNISRTYDANKDREGDAEPITPHKIALTHPRFPRLDTQAYNPTKGGELIYEQYGLKTLNTYQKPSLQADPDKEEEAATLLNAHLERLIPLEKNRQFLLSWFAFVVQNPGIKIRWSPFIQGVQGCGKTTLAEIMKPLLGRNNVGEIDKTKLASSFNDWVDGKQLLVFDEIFTNLEGRKALTEQIKAIVSNTTLSLTRKYQDSTDTPNYTNSIFFANNKDGVHIDSNDRRFFVLFCKQQKKSELAEFPQGYFENLYRLTSPFHLAGGLLSYYQNYKLHPEFNPNGTAPVTRDRESVISAGSSELEFAISDILAAKEHPLVAKDIIVVSAIDGLLKGRRERNVTSKGLAMALSRIGYTFTARASISSHLESIWINSDECELDAQGVLEVVRQRDKEFKTRELSDS